MIFLYSIQVCFMKASEWCKPVIATIVKNVSKVTCYTHVFRYGIRLPNANDTEGKISSNILFSLCPVTGNVATFVKSYMSKVTCRYNSIVLCVQFYSHADKLL